MVDSQFANTEEDDGPPEGYTHGAGGNPLKKTAGRPRKEGTQVRRKIEGEPPRKRGRPVRDPRDPAANHVDLVVTDEDVAILEKSDNAKRAWAEKLMKYKENRLLLKDARENNGVPRTRGMSEKQTYRLNIRDMIEMALSELGGVQWLVKQAKANPSAFFTLLGKTMPLQVAAERDNPGGVGNTRVEHVIVFKQTVDVVDVVDV